MSHLETIKNDLKRRATDSLELAINELERVLSPQSALFDTFLLIKGQFKKYREEFLIGLLAQEQSAQIYTRLMSAFLNLVGSISDADLLLEKKHTTTEKRGDLLYHIPRAMQLLREERCIIRIAWSGSDLFQDWKPRATDVHRKNLRIAEIMGVELFCLSEDNPFQIRSLHTTVQFLDSEDNTEWVFYVKPLRTGDYQLALRISVIEMRENREVKRDLVLEEQISVSTEAPQKGQNDTFAVAPVSYCSGTNQITPPPGSFMAQMANRFGVFLAALIVCGLFFFTSYDGNKNDIAVIVPEKRDTFKKSLQEENRSELASVDNKKNENTWKYVQENNKTEEKRLKKKNTPELVAVDNLQNKKVQIDKQQIINPFFDTPKDNELAAQIRDILIGGNAFDVSNIEIKGGTGTFTNGSSNIGFSNGVIIATGPAETRPGSTKNGFNTNLFEDKDLAGLSGNQQLDVSKIEFDFTPTSNQSTFDYVFASEEYCEFVDSKYNDVFGFFIVGPGVGLDNNIAEMPSMLPKLQNPPIQINSRAYYRKTEEPSLLPKRQLQNALIYPRSDSSQLMLNRFIFPLDSFFYQRQFVAFRNYNLLFRPVQKKGIIGNF